MKRIKLMGLILVLTAVKAGGWEISDNPDICPSIGLHGGLSALGGVRNQITRVPGRHDQKEREQDKINAAFIVRTVNSHAALVKALKHMVEAYEADKKHGIAFGNDNAADEAREAIIQAEGQL